MKKNLLVLALSFVVILAACKKDQPDPPGGTAYELTQLPPSSQRSGDAAAGYDYLIYGDYVGGGVPYDAFLLGFGEDNSNVLGRTGDNAVIPPAYTAIDAFNGVRVVSANCLQCHGQALNGEYYIGLGNSLIDFTTDQSNIIPALDLAIGVAYGNPSPEWDAYLPLRRGINAIGPHLITEVRGSNVADKLAAVLAAHRSPDDLSWNATAQIPIPDEVIPTDVPAWWILKKKNAMFYNGLGRGDFARTMMASGLLTLQDSADAHEIDERFADVLAYINTLEPPVFPNPIDQNLADEGKIIFENNCTVCHGSYGDSETYPNLLVGLNTIGTDPMLAEKYFEYTGYLNWYNNGWFGNGENAGYLEPGAGYVAPPLDGVWATAPYLHNGSVPTLEDLLNSSQRPVFWERSFNSSDFDFDKVGWNYTVPASGAGTAVFDATIEGYGNQGHTFGDELTTQERAALIEYLKTL